jgi:hypothetical protein
MKSWKRTSLLSICVVVILGIASLSNGQIKKIVGITSNGPILLGPGTPSVLCTSPCPDFFDVATAEGTGIFYGNRALGASDTSCRKSIDGGVTWPLCSGAYPVSGIAREIDIPSDGRILSLRIQGGVNACRLDKSTDRGASWTTIDIVTGVNLQCSPYTSAFPGEHLRCVNTICLVLVNNVATGDHFIYRSTDSGDTWGLVNTQLAPIACATDLNIFFDGSNGVVTCHRYLTGQVTGILVSNGGGAVWTFVTPPANIDFCAQVNSFSGDGIQVACGNSGVTDIRLMNMSGAATTPIQPAISTGDTLNPLSEGPNLVQRSSGQWYIFMTTSVPDQRIWFSNSLGSSFIETAESISGTFRKQLTQARMANGILYFTAGDFTFNSYN